MHLILPNANICLKFIKSSTFKPKLITFTKRVSFVHEIKGEGCIDQVAHSSKEAWNNTYLQNLKLTAPRNFKFVNKIRFIYNSKNGN